MAKRPHRQTRRPSNQIRGLEKQISTSVRHLSPPPSPTYTHSYLSDVHACVYILGICICPFVFILIATPVSSQAHLNSSISLLLPFRKSTRVNMHERTHKHIHTHIRTHKYLHTHIRTLIHRRIYDLC